MELLVSLGLILILVALLCVTTELLFLSSLESLAQRWNLPSSVAGATLMAMGSSAPELFIALLSLFRDGGAHSDLGIGTIVGSAVFNILVITGASGLVRHASARRNVILRDCAAYVLTVGVLIFVIFDGEVSLYESLALLGSYGIYLLVLFFWKQEDLETDQPEDEAGLFDAVAVLQGVSAYFTRHPYLGFFISILVIGALCWRLVSEAIFVSSALGIPPVLVGLTVIAGATSLPDLLSSIAASRRGRGEQALANAIGSNVFDISIGLCVPWVLAIGLFSARVRVGVEKLSESIAVLVCTVLLFMLLALRKGGIGKREGAVLLVTYVSYIVYLAVAD